MTKIFVSYRRDDSGDTADYIVAHLTDVTRSFAREDIFFDVDSIPLGVNVRRYINERVAQCVVMLVIIGREWVTITRDDGTRRLDVPGDYVRLEVEAAIARGIPMIPVLVRGADFPNANDLPESLREVVEYNGLYVRRAPDFKHDMARLIEALKQITSVVPAAEPVQEVQPATPNERLGYGDDPVEPPAQATVEPIVEPAPPKKRKPKTPASESAPLSIPDVFTPVPVPAETQFQEAPPPIIIEVAAKPAAKRKPAAKTSELDWLKQFKLLNTLTGHTNTVYDCAVSPNGKWIVSASADNTLIVWDARARKLAYTLKGHTGHVRGCAISSDSRWVVSAGGDNTLKMWDLSNGKLLSTLKGHTAAVYCCAITPDGSRIASGADDRTVRIWDTQTGHLIHTLTGHAGGWMAHAVKACAFSPDGTHLASGSDDTYIKLWDTATGDEIRTLTPEMMGINDCHFSADGTWLLAAGVNAAKKFSVTKTKSSATYSHYGVLYGCAISPDGTWVASVSHSATLKIHNAATGGLVHELTGHTGAVRGVAISPDGQWIVSSGTDSAVKIWGTPTS